MVHATGGPLHLGQETWLQRYLVNTDDWCGSNCPVSFYTVNKCGIKAFASSTGWMCESAQQLYAMLVYAHRFRGQSMPYKIDPFKVGPDEIHILTKQRLADFALKTIQGDWACSS